MPVVPVLLPVAIDAPLSYLAAEAPPPGAMVVAPIGPRLSYGIVWNWACDAVDPGRLKPIEAVLDTPPLPPATLAFIDWVANWTLSPRGMVARMALRSPEAFEPPAPRTGYRASGVAVERLTPARARVLELLADGLAWEKRALARAAAVSPSVVDGLLACGALETVALPPEPLVEPPNPAHATPDLTPDQSRAAEALAAAVAARAFSTTLLEGVTGSGKTEVYFEAVAEALRQGRQALVLLPEIALTAAFIERFTARFGARPAEWHSAVSARRRERIWRGVIDGSVPAVIGARSALFLPFRDLGLIVVDEEHDAAYKQEDGVVYHARDMAVVRGKIGEAAVVLSSATPSVETRHNAEGGRYRHLLLPERFAARLPEVATVDLRRAPPERGRFLAPPLVSAIERTLGAGEQALLFLNRRGYAPLTLCRACGHRFTCPNCSTWLVEHRFRGVLACHHCGHQQRRPDACSACGAGDSLVPCGPGVERIAEEVAIRFPHARLLVMSSDTSGGVERLRAELRAIAHGDVDIVVGTQVVAKGHHFPGLTLVGVIDADLGLAQADPRAAERTFQLLSQVTGRAGRADRAGTALIQTHAPDHPVMQALAAHDRNGFYAAEIEVRRRHGLPPFGRLAAIIVSARRKEAAEDCARRLARTAPRASGVSVFGPAEAPIALMRGRHRIRLAVQAARGVDLQAYLRAWLSAAGRPKGGARLHLDIDPQTFL